MRTTRFLSPILFFLLFVGNTANAQENPFARFRFLIGDWQGNGSGFGNEKSSIQSSFKLVMNDLYIEVVNDSQFEPTEAKPDGEHHVDHGFMSYDQNRDIIIFRQFNIEGYVNQYVLVDSLSNDTTFVFDTEVIENFVPNGSARWEIHRHSPDQITTLFYVTMDGENYMCLGTNHLQKK